MVCTGEKERRGAEEKIGGKGGKRKELGREKKGKGKEKGKRELKRKKGIKKGNQGTKGDAGKRLLPAPLQQHALPRPHSPPLAHRTLSHPRATLARNGLPPAPRLCFPARAQTLALPREPA